MHEPNYPSLHVNYVFHHFLVPANMSATSFVIGDLARRLGTEGCYRLYKPLFGKGRYRRPVTPLISLISRFHCDAIWFSGSVARVLSALKGCLRTIRLEYHYACMKLAHAYRLKANLLGTGSIDPTIPPPRELIRSK